MLGAFFTPPYRDWWLAYVENPESMIPLHNHWLVRKSSAAVFSQGLIRFDRLETSMFEVMQSGIPTFRTISAFATNQSTSIKSTMFMSIGIRKH